MKIEDLKGLSKEELSKLFLNLVNRIDKISETYEKMYYDGIRELDTYSYVGVFKSITTDVNKKIIYLKKLK